MKMKNKNEIIAALDAAHNCITKEIVSAIKSGNYSTARKYITTTRHLSIAAEFMGRKNG